MKALADMVVFRTPAEIYTVVGQNLPKISVRLAELSSLVIGLQFCIKAFR